MDLQTSWVLFKVEVHEFRTLIAFKKLFMMSGKGTIPEREENVAEVKSAHLGSTLSSSSLCRTPRPFPEEGVLVHFVQLQNPIDQGIYKERNSLLVALETVTFQVEEPVSGEALPAVSAHGLTSLPRPHVHSRNSPSAPVIMVLIHGALPEGPWYFLGVPSLSSFALGIKIPTHEVTADRNFHKSDSENCIRSQPLGRTSDRCIRPCLGQ